MRDDLTINRALGDKLPSDPVVTFVDVGKSSCATAGWIAIFITTHDLNHPTRRHPKHRDRRLMAAAMETDGGELMATGHTRKGRHEMAKGYWIARGNGPIRTVSGM